MMAVSHYRAIIIITPFFLRHHQPASDSQKRKKA